MMLKLMLVIVVFSSRVSGSVCYYVCVKNIRVMYEVVNVVRMIVVFVYIVVLLCCV